MITFAAEGLFRASRSVLTTDLIWPPYLEALKSTAHKYEASLHIVPIRNKILEDQSSSDDVVSLLLESARRFNCDGLFLSDIIFLGIRLPVQEIIRKLPDRDCIFVAIDGAQALNHRPVDLSHLDCDLYLARTQKWFGAYHPLRIAIAGREKSRHRIKQLSAQTLAGDGIRDPLFAFTEMLSGNAEPAYGETVNIAGLMVTSGALTHIMKKPYPLVTNWKQRLHDVVSIGNFIGGADWQPLLAHESLRSGIALLQKRQTCTCSSGHPLRTALSHFQIVASEFPGNILRLSMPEYWFPWRYLSQLQRALYSIV